MRLYSLAVLIAALAMPAFCQTPSPDPDVQARALADQAAQLAAQGKQMAIAAQSLSADQAATLDEQIAKAAAKADAADAIADKFATVDIDSQLSNLKMQFDSAKIADMDEVAAKMADKLSQFKYQFDSQDFADMADNAAAAADKFNMAFLQGPVPKVPPMPPMGPIGPKGRIYVGRGEGQYDAGMRALDQHKYDEAVTRFNAVIDAKSPRPDGALYWKAFALNREGKRDEALAAIAQLRRDYASSGYMNDAQALEAEVKQNAGQPVSPAQESNEDLKLLAINSLMNADPERAIPLIEGILKGTSAPNVKDRALFVLAQSKSPRAQQVLSDYAKGSGNPDLQLTAIQYVGMSRTKESEQLLAGIYSTSTDTRVKNSILQSLMASRDWDALMNIAKTEKDGSLRDSAIRYVASDKSAPNDGLLALYGSADVQTKHAIVDGFMSRRDAKTLVDLAHKETDPAMKLYIAERLGQMRDNKDAMDYMMELLK